MNSTILSPGYFRACGWRALAMVFVLILLPACDKGESGKAITKPELPDASPFPSTYQAAEHKPLVIHNAKLLVGNGESLEDVSIVVMAGKFSAIGADVPVPDDATELDAEGRWITPGLLDVHSHMGVYPAPQTANHADGNEMTSPVTAEVWAEHSVWPQDPYFEKAIAGGVTTFQVLPGSGNLIGGRGVTLKNVRSLTVQGMKFPGAPYSLKMACGENPKRVYGGKGQMPSTRMGNMAIFRKSWIEAAAYRKKWDDYVEKIEAGEEADIPDRDLRLETLVGVLKGEILIHNHCYRADEMAQMIDMSHEFGYQITAFHHAVEAYKVAPLLAKENVCAVMWADWWGFKQEAFDMVRENLALVDYAGACAIIHSDDGIQVQRLNQELAKAMTAGRQMGLDLTPAHVIQWLTLNSARSLGLDKQIGSVEVGKNADLVLWHGDPFSVYGLAEKVWIDGTLQFDRSDSSVQKTSDFNLGVLDPLGDRP